MATKNTTASASKINATAAAADTTDAHIKNETMGSTMDGLFNSFALPTGKRVLVSFVVGVVLAAVVGYLAMPLVAYVTAYASVLTGSAFITFMVQFMAYVLTIAVAGFTGGRAQSFILSGDIDRCYSAVGSYVGGWFSKKPAVTS